MGNMVLGLVVFEVSRGFSTRVKMTVTTSWKTMGPGVLGNSRGYRGQHLMWRDFSTRRRPSCFESTHSDDGRFGFRDDNGGESVARRDGFAGQWWKMKKSKKNLIEFSSMLNFYTNPKIYFFLEKIVDQFSNFIRVVHPHTVFP